MPEKEMSEEEKRFDRLVYWRNWGFEEGISNWLNAEENKELYRLGKKLNKEIPPTPESLKDQYIYDTLDDAEDLGSPRD